MLGLLVNRLKNHRVRLCSGARAQSQREPQHLDGTKPYSRALLGAIAARAAYPLAELLRDLILAQNVLVDLLNHGAHLLRPPGCSLAAHPTERNAELPYSSLAPLTVTEKMMDALVGETRVILASL